MNTVGKTMLVLGLLSAATLAPAPEARACGNFVFHGEEVARYRGLRVAQPTAPPLAPIERVRLASIDLQSHRPAQAVQHVALAFPSVRDSAVASNVLETRAQRIAALAVVRLEGAASSALPFATRTQYGKERNLRWAIAVLQRVSEKRDGEPQARAEFAEALAAIPSLEDESYRILRTLADEDLLGTAEGYRTLARLHAARGESGESDKALDRCKLMAAQPQEVCTVGGSPSKKDWAPTPAGARRVASI